MEDEKPKDDKKEVAKSSLIADAQVNCCSLLLPLKYVALCCLIFQTTSAVIFTRYSRSFMDGPKYYSSTLVVMSEFTKLSLSCFFVFFLDCVTTTTTSRLEQFKQVMYDENFKNPSDTMKLIVPAFFYTVQNNLVYVALSNLEATTFQVGYQMKVITTACLSVVLLNRSLSVQKWVALFLLTAGIVMTQLKQGAKDNTTEKQNFTLGLISVVICGFCSAFAGVYFEKILKGTNPSVWIRNAQLAFFSTLLGLLCMLYENGLEVFYSFFQGYNWMVWTIILIQAAGGLIVAVVVKYADNILKGFAAALSIVLCGICSTLLFAFEPTSAFLFGSFIVIAATVLYSLPDTPAPTPRPAV